LYVFIFSCFFKIDQSLKRKLDSFALGLETGNLEGVFHKFVVNNDVGPHEEQVPVYNKFKFHVRHTHLCIPEQSMTKSTTTYWNALTPENRDRWTPVKGLEGLAEELTLSIDPVTGEYTRLTRFLPGADTSPFGGKAHAYPEEVFIVSGRLYDHAFGRWLKAGDYASRPPGELHGPFRTDQGCVVLEVSFPNRTVEDKDV